MKKFTALLPIIALLSLSGCRVTYPVAQESGTEDMAYLIFVAQNLKPYPNKTIQVILDNGEPYTAKVVKEKKSRRLGTQYGVTPGTRSLKVVCDGKTLYDKKVFLSTGEVKRINLP